MEPVYVDLHIHTSSDPNSLDENYDVDLLKSKVEAIAGKHEYLISFTDHNVINKKVYLKAVKKIKHLLLGAELHVRNYDDAPPYHTHIIFKVESITSDVIDDINEKLKKLYPKKVVSGDDDIPYLHQIINKFNSYDVLLLPHGGQSHSTFDRSISEGVEFDEAVERSVYYNQFDGFTARSNSGLERTQNYFKKLGIFDFVNLVTCTDNYSPDRYPEAKAKDASPFIPTWMFALPTFEGLRLSLSESSRLVYSDKAPTRWSQFISYVKLKNDHIDIDVKLTPGLNVVIGGSSSGKTLFVDSLYNKLSSDFSGSIYLSTKYDVQSLEVVHTSGIKPHYISQNYITKVVDSKDTDNRVDDIDIIKNVFPQDEEINKKVEKGLCDLRSDLKILVDSVKDIESAQKELSHIPVLSSLIITEKIDKNILQGLMPSKDDTKGIEYKESDYDNHIEALKQIEALLEKNVFHDSSKNLVEALRQELIRLFKISELEKDIRGTIKKEKKKIDEELRKTNQEQQSKVQDYDKLLSQIAIYVTALVKYRSAKERIANYSVKCATKSVEVMGHKLSIENTFKLDKGIFLDCINNFIKKDCKVDNFECLEPESLFKNKYTKKNPKIATYDEFESKVNAKFEQLNKKTYRIVTAEGADFDKLSAGWKTSVILDLILGYEGDMAPIIIDQPEDNLATKYINEGLIKAIKNIKAKKQIILVSHNATIPMLGDAQNVVLCNNDEGIITIKANRLESSIAERSIVDYIAEITDGGKGSIKKRVKKYNLKKFRG